LVESPSPATVYCSVRNCIDGFVHTHDAGFGARNPATSSHCGSSALVETFHFDGSTWLSTTAAAVEAVAGAGAVAGAAAGCWDADGLIAAGGLGAGASVHAASVAASAAETSNEWVRGVRMRAIA